MLTDPPADAEPTSTDAAIPPAPCSIPGMLMASWMTGTPVPRAAQSARRRRRRRRGAQPPHRQAPRGSRYGRFDASMLVSVDARDERAPASEAPPGPPPSPPASPDLLGPALLEQRPYAASIAPDAPKELRSSISAELLEGFVWALETRPDLAERLRIQLLSAGPAASTAAKMTVGEYAAHTRFSKRAIENFIREGLPLEGTGRRRRIPVNEADAWRKGLGQRAVREEIERLARANARKSALATVLSTRGLASQKEPGTMEAGIEDTPSQGGRTR